MNIYQVLHVLKGQNAKDDEAIIGDGGMDYVRQDCEGTWFDVVQ